ncbi:lipid-A-disaccharide synthase [Pectinatus frisingensis]|uniref:lipid-A-disaccharide synthase n=1 Tax=Pectinatus frisingensis TaxID=865 RepID=UPI0018C72F3C|nr:lipid-A-disaccharide synthase [Pectinatus frisingensis]
MYKIMFSAGEASGDLHGASLAAALRKIEPNIEMVGFGGTMMENAGVKLIANMTEYSVMGFYEVIINLYRSIKLRNKLVDYMKKEKPDILVLIDYPDFNWRLAPVAKKLGIPVFSYIPPSAWAWRKGRAKQVAKTADQIAAIFPFETAVYEQAGANIKFVGNPLIDTVRPSLDKESAARCFSIDTLKTNILLLPGSRRQEITAIFPVMLATAVLFKEKYSSICFHVAVAQGIKIEELQKIAAEYDVVINYHKDKIYDLMSCCDIGLATSGTVILEAALMGLPTVVLYRMSKLTYHIAKMFVDVKFFSLPNILLKERVMPELLQEQVNPENVFKSAQTLLSDNKQYVKSKLKTVRAKLGSPGVAERTARLIIATADKKINPMNRNNA